MYLNLSILSGVIAIVCGLLIARWIIKLPAGSEKMQEIAGAIQAGAKAYLNRQYKTIAVIAVIIAAILYYKLGSNTAAGFLVVGLGMVAVAGFYYLTKDISALIGLGFGGSLISVFARLGGGIYTKAADVGADLVGKVEKG